jgi:hypothetical protein
MARDMRISQPVMWRVMHGKQAPTAKLIESLARDPHVNPHWLFWGEGSPTEKEPGQIMALPVATRLPPGVPSEHPDYFEGGEFPVAAALCRLTRCWYEVSEKTAVLRNPDARLQAGDLLLLDYDIHQRTNLVELDGRIAAAQVRTAGNRGDHRLELGIVDYSCGPDEELLTLVTGKPDFSHWKGVKRVPAQVTTKDKTSSKMVTLDETSAPAFVDSQGRISPIPEHTLAPITYSIQATDIVAVCVGVFRR